MTRFILCIAVFLLLAPVPAAAQCQEETIFADSFETGTKPPWDAELLANGGKVSQQNGAANGATGSQVLSALLPGLSSAKAAVRNISPNDALYQASFYFNPAGLTMAHATNHVIFGLRSGANVLLARVKLRRSFSKFQVAAAAREDGDGLSTNDDTWVQTGWFTISGWTKIEIIWKASDSPTSYNGSMELWLNDEFQQRIYNIDNDLCRVCKADLGAVDEVDSSTSGTYQFDEFESRRCTETGTP